MAVKRKTYESCLINPFLFKEPSPRMSFDDIQAKQAYLKTLRKCSQLYSVAICRGYVL